MSDTHVVLGSNRARNNHSADECEDPGVKGTALDTHAYLAERKALPEALVVRVRKLRPQTRDGQRQGTGPMADESDFYPCYIRKKGPAFVCRSMTRFFKVK